MKTRVLLQLGIILAVGALLPQAAQAQGDIQSGFNYLHQNYGTTCQQSGGYAPGCGNAPAAPAASAAPAAPAAPALNPALANAAQSIGYSLGQQLGKALFGDPAAQAAAAAAAQQNALAAQQRALAAQQLYNSGIYLFKQRDYSGAINEFQKALAISPNDANILHDLARAKQQIKDTAVAAQTSGELGKFLYDAPANAGTTGSNQLPTANPNASALSLVNLDANAVDFRGLPGNTAAPGTIPNSDPNVVNLSGTTSTSPASLKSQIDAVFGNPTLASAPPAAQVTPADVSAVFDKPLPDPNATMKAIFDLNDKSK
ncbi:MAG: tetratricopeptide repeat protein [Candidatus Korobacteraceae bacterium]